MSRIAKNPVKVPNGVEVAVKGQNIIVKGSKGAFDYAIHESVEVSQEGEEIKFAPRESSKGSMALAGTMRALVNNMVYGVSTGFEKKLELVGVGYRAQAKGKSVNLQLGFSHPVDHPIPDGLTVETPSQTEIIIKGADKQLVGQVAADIRAYRPPEPYKGKGVRYSDEHVVRKEAKKK